LSHFRDLFDEFSGWIRPDSGNPDLNRQHNPVLFFVRIYPDLLNFLIRWIGILGLI